MYSVVRRSTVTTVTLLTVDIVFVLAFIHGCARDVKARDRDRDRDETLVHLETETTSLPLSVFSAINIFNMIALVDGRR